MVLFYKITELIYITVFIIIIMKNIIYTKKQIYIIFVQLLSHVQLFVTPWIAAHQASLSTTNSQSLL